MSIREVFYSCGTCGYKLKLCSSNRSVGSDFKKETKKGLISFASLDETRFKHHDELRCGLYCESPTSWRLHRLKTRLLCGQCEARIGTVCEEGVSSLVGCNGFDSGSESSTTGQKRYLVKIRALQPEQDADETPSMMAEKDE
ncbi:unnamed protein product [Calypogeia fissa]